MMSAKLLFFLVVVIYLLIYFMILADLSLLVLILMSQLKLKNTSCVFGLVGPQVGFGVHSPVEG